MRVLPATGKGAGNSQIITSRRNQFARLRLLDRFNRRLSHVGYTII
jgi:hypothetical protein